MSVTRRNCDIVDLVNARVPTAHAGMAGRAINLSQQACVIGLAVVIHARDVSQHMLVGNVRALIVCV
jgi:hypothetical protein